jgi:hypothetical protein
MDRYTLEHRVRHERVWRVIYTSDSAARVLDRLAAQAAMKRPGEFRIVDTHTSEVVR